MTTLPVAAVERPAVLRSDRDVRAVRGTGRRARATAATVAVRPRDDGGAPRVAVVAGRRIGGAVQRNRAKRRLRAALREVGVRPGQDVVVAAAPPALRISFPALCAELADALDRAAPARDPRRESR